MVRWAKTARLSTYAEMPDQAIYAKFYSVQMQQIYPTSFPTRS